MELNETYRLVGFKAFLEEDEDAERHLFHECGHEWLGLEYGAKLVDFQLQPGAVSQVRMSGIRSIEHYYEIGVAGMLAEAKGILPPWHRDCLLDLDRMPRLAAALIPELTSHKNDENYPLYPDVPFRSRIPSTMWAELSVADLWIPLQQGISEKLLTDALIGVSKKLNSPRGWGSFLEHVEHRRGHN